MRSPRSRRDAPVPTQAVGSRSHPAPHPYRASEASHRVGLGEDFRGWRSSGLQGRCLVICDRTPLGKRFMRWRNRGPWAGPWHPRLRARSISSPPAAFVPIQPGWDRVRTYVDQTSGAYAERPALSEALRDARLGLYDVLLVYRVDRFARSLKVLVHLLEELDQAGVAFRSATEPIDTSTATGRMLVQLLG